MHCYVLATNPGSVSCLRPVLLRFRSLSSTEQDKKLLDDEEIRRGIDLYMDRHMD